MNPSNIPLELLHIETRHQEMIQEAAQQRLIREIREEKPGLLQSVRALFAGSAPAVSHPAPQPRAKTPRRPANPRKANPRTV